MASIVVTDKGGEERTAPARHRPPRPSGERTNQLKLVCVDGRIIQQTEIKASKAEALPAPVEGLLKPSQW
jgi:hypothetical protein